MKLAQSFRSSGKLMLTGEYFVLEGTTALALPTRSGQSLSIYQSEEPTKSFLWKSMDLDGQSWLELPVNKADFSIPQSFSSNSVAKRLVQLFKAAQALSPGFISNDFHLYAADSHLEFPSNWGLGSSSTLISNIAAWANVDPFLLSNATFGGSGYDIACANAKSAICYSIVDQKPKVEEVQFNPPFRDKIYFVHLGKKQNSRTGIKSFYENWDKNTAIIKWLTDIGQRTLTCNSIEKFEGLMNEHENLISDALNMPKAKSLYFQDFWGSVKSLGAWGGDFVMISSTKSAKETYNYFETRGFKTILSFDEMILPFESIPSNLSIKEPSL